MRKIKVHFDQEERDFNNITTPESQPIMQKPQHKHTDHFLLTITTPAQDLTSIQHFKSLIDPQAHYQIIPTAPQTLVCNLQQFIEAAAEASKNKILDVALPFQKLAKQKLTQYYFGRYIFKDRKLLAVRLASSDKQKYLCYPCSNIMKWPKKVVEKISISFQLKEYYKKQGIKAQQIVPIGDFILNMTDACFGLLFQSQLNQDPRLLAQYDRLGINILSVIDDVPNQLVNSGKTINYNSYRAMTPSAHKIRRESDVSIISYAGVRFAPLNCIYLTLPFIQEQNKFETGSYSIWNDSLLSMKCSVPEPSKRLRSQTIDLETLTVIEIKEKLNILGQETVEKVKTVVINPQLSVPETISKKNGDMKPLLNLIYLYKHANLFNKFTVPVSINRSFLAQLSKLATFLGKPIGEVVIAYQMRSLNASNQALPLLPDIKTYPSLQSIVQEGPNLRICVYSDEVEQKYYLQRIAASHSNIIILSQYLSSIFEYQNNQILRSIQIQKANSFVDSVIQQRVYDLKQILKLARSKEFNLDLTGQVQAITQRLKNRLRQCYIINPLSEYLISTDSETILKQLIQTEVSLAQNSEGIRMHQMDQNILYYQRLKSSESLDSSNNKNKEKSGKPIMNSFEKMLERAKEIKMRSQSKQIQCHYCLTYMESTFVYNCQQCKNGTCYPCISELFKPINCKQKESFQYCMVCLKICKCKKCQNLSNELQSQNMSFQIQKKVQKQGMEENCSRCDVIGRKSENIRVLCSICNFNQCWKCAKDSNRIKTGYQWICDDCRPMSQSKSPHSSKHSEMNEQKAEQSLKNNKLQRDEPKKQTTIMVQQTINNGEKHLSNSLKVTQQKKNIQIYLSSADRNTKKRPKIPSPPKTQKQQVKHKILKQNIKQLRSQFDSSKKKKNNKSQSSSSHSSSISGRSKSSSSSSSYRSDSRQKSINSKGFHKPSIKKFEFQTKFVKKETKENSKFSSIKRKNQSSNSKGKKSRSRSKSSSRSRSSSKHRNTKKFYKKDKSRRSQSQSKQRKETKQKGWKTLTNTKNNSQNKSKGLWSRQSNNKLEHNKKILTSMPQEKDFITKEKEDKYHSGKILNLAKYENSDNIDY